MRSPDRGNSVSWAKRKSDGLRLIKKGNVMMPKSNCPTRRLFGACGCPKWIFPFTTHLSPPCPAQPLQSLSLSVSPSGHNGPRPTVSFSLSLISSQRERRQTAAGSHGVLDALCMTYKPEQRHKLHETSGGRLVTFWYGVGVFPMLCLCCCCCCC